MRDRRWIHQTLMAEALRDPSPQPSPRLRGEGWGEGLWFNRVQLFSNEP